MTDEQKPDEVEETPQESPEEAVAPEEVEAAEQSGAAGADEEPAEAPAAEAPAETPEAPAETPAAPTGEETDEESDEFVEEDATPRVKPEIPGMDLEVDIVREGEEALREDEEDPYGDADSDSAEEELSQPIADAAIDLAAGARYTATGKRKTAVARVILKPGNGNYEINGRTLDVFFPRPALQRTIRTALETVGLEEKIDVVARMHGGGVAAQAGALRHGISRALVDADPNLRSELKRRGFLTRDARVKERKKAGLKKARKRPQFSKR